ncbi:hypothetical protein [Methanoculleus sp. UBA416]
MKSPLPPIEYRATDITGIYVIHPLWVRPNAHHHAHARTVKICTSG